MAVDRLARIARRLAQPTVITLHAFWDLDRCLHVWGEDFHQVEEALAPVGRPRRRTKDGGPGDDPASRPEAPPDYPFAARASGVEAAMGAMGAVGAQDSPAGAADGPAVQAHGRAGRAVLRLPTESGRPRTSRDLAAGGLVTRPWTVPTVTFHASAAPGVLLALPADGDGSAAIGGSLRPGRALARRSRGRVGTRWPGVVPGEEGGAGVRAGAVAGSPGAIQAGSRQHRFPSLAACGRRASAARSARHGGRADS